MHVIGHHAPGEQFAVINRRAEQLVLYDRRRFWIVEVQRTRCRSVEELIRKNEELLLHPQHALLATFP